MNFTDIVSSVLGTLKRPDKLNEVRREVNAAILHYCSLDNFAEDIQEIQYQLPVAGSEAIINTVSEFTRYRKIAYIKISGTKIYVKPLDSLVPEPCADLRNKYYQAGVNLNINLSQSATHLDIGYYQYPPTLTDASPTHWILNGNWYAVEQKALATLLNDIGDTGASQLAERKAAMAFVTFKNDKRRGGEQ